VKDDEARKEFFKVATSSEASELDAAVVLK
jgi:hypothetical protein